MLQTIQTIYFLWRYDPGIISVSFIAELSPVYGCLVFKLCPGSILSILVEGWLKLISDGIRFHELSLRNQCFNARFRQFQILTLIQVCHLFDHHLQFEIKKYPIISESQPLRYLHISQYNVEYLLLWQTSDRRYQAPWTAAASQLGVVDEDLGLLTDDTIKNIGSYLE